MALSPESQALLQSLFTQIDRMKLEDIKAFGEYAVKRGIETSGVALQPVADIMKRYGEQKITKAAQLGMSDMEFRERQRQFGEQLGLSREELAARRQQFAEQMGWQREQFGREEAWRREQWKEQRALYERGLQEQAQARRRAERDWWKNLIAPVLGIGASILFPPAAPAIMGGMATGKAIGRAAKPVAGLERVARATGPAYQSYQPFYDVG